MYIRTEEKDDAKPSRGNELVTCGDMWYRKEHANVVPQMPDNALVCQTNI